MLPSPDIIFYLRTMRVLQKMCLVLVFVGYSYSSLPIVGSDEAILSFLFKIFNLKCSSFRK